MSRSKRWQQFWQFVQPYWNSPERSTAIGLLLVLMGLSIGSSICLILETLQRGELLSALAAQDTERFFQALLRVGILILASVPLLSLKGYLQERLGLSWRSKLTEQFQQLYFHPDRFYRIHTTPDLDNPDQRLTEDIRHLTQRSLHLFVLFCDSIVQLLGFVAVLWLISQALLATLLLYALTITLITSLLFGRILIRLNAEQLKREADFRFSLVRIAENAESIAFYQGQEQELNLTQRLFASLYHNFDRLLRWQFNLMIVQNGYQYLTFILPFIILAPRLFAGELEIGAVSQSQAAFERIGLALGLVITQFEPFSALIASLDRLDRLQRTAQDSPTHHTATLTYAIPAEPTLALHNVTLAIPQTSRVLIQDLSFVIAPQQSLLIMGASGVGKSSLLRSIAGLWRTGSGHILAPARHNLFFLPQRPYLILGSLRQQLQYPQSSSYTDTQILTVLEQVQLTNLLDRWQDLSAETDWSKVLSLGEQQRLAFARLLLCQPQYALLDEATSALDEATEAHLYSLLQSTSIAFLSIGHRPTLIPYHQQVLELRRDRSWKIVGSSKC